MKKIRGMKGITLVGLIVTVVILLILTGISLASFIGSGIFEKVGLAKQKHENAQLKEETTLDEYENIINGYLLGTTREDDGISKEQYEQLVAEMQALKTDLQNAKAELQNGIDSVETELDSIITGNYTINKLGEVTGTSIININASLYDALYIKTIESVYSEISTFYIPTFDLTEGSYTANGGALDPGRFLRIQVTNSGVRLATILTNSIDCTATSKLVVYGIKY